MNFLNFSYMNETGNIGKSKVNPEQKYILRKCKIVLRKMPWERGYFLHIHKHKHKVRIWSLGAP